jgi:hypothetical protein
MVIPPKPVVIPPPVEVRRPTAAEVAPPKQVVIAPPRAARSPRRLIFLGALGLLAVLLVAGGGFGYRWYSQRKARQSEAAEQADLDDRKTTIRANFAPAALKRFAQKLPAWEIAPTAEPKLKGKAIVLSVNDAADRPRSFWTQFGSHWPIDAEEDGADLIKDLFERGEADELTFKLSEYRWAGAPAEAATIIGIRWRKELGGVFVNDKLVEVDAGLLSPENAGDLPIALRIRATVVVLDKAAARLVARRTVLGPLPTLKPAAGKKDVTGPRPDVAQWLQRLEAGKP